jgi:hypothetical protein
MQGNMSNLDKWRVFCPCCLQRVTVIGIAAYPDLIDKRHHFSRLGQYMFESSLRITISTDFESTLQIYLDYLPF